MSSKRAAQLVRTARADGVPVTAETCPHYLTLTAQDYERVGPTMKVYPPIRTDEDRDALWEAVRDGTITSVGSDHAPHTLDEKQLGLARAPAGSTGVETLASVMVDRMCRGAISPERLAWVLSEGTARLYGLHPRKGSLQPGADADLTLVDPNARRTVSGDRLHTKQRYSPWEGVTLSGVPVLSLLRGHVIMRQGEPIGEPRGAFVGSARSEPKNRQPSG
jgi:dihydroorotase